MESWSEILVYFYDAINIYVSLIPPKIIRSGGKGGVGKRESGRNSR